MSKLSFSDLVAEARKRCEVERNSGCGASSCFASEIRTTIDKARGTRDDLRALARCASGPAAHYGEEAKLKLGEEHDADRREYRRLQDISNAYSTAANLVARAFGIPEQREDDPEFSGSWRLLNDAGEPIA